MSFLPRAGVAVAIVICVCDIAALCIAFIAGMKYAQNKREESEQDGEIDPALLANTTGLPVTDPSLAKAEADWDKDSGAV